MTTLQFVLMIVSAVLLLWLIGAALFWCVMDEVGPGWWTKLRNSRYSTGEEYLCTVFWPITLIVLAVRFVSRGVWFLLTGSIKAGIRSVKWDDIK